MQDEELNLSSVFGPPIHIEGLRYLEDGDEICLDSDPSFSLKVIYAPGHTVDSIVLYSERDRAAFVGDSIYKGCIGDYQYPGGDYELLLKNVKEKILTLPDDTVLYTNLRKNNLYHSSSACGELGTRRPETVTYAELCGEKGKKLKACPACAPELKRSELEEINALYAPGGDHDPGMTEARKDCPRKIR